MLGGMMTPMVEDAAVTPTEFSLSYPLSIIAGISIFPTPAVSAWEEPETPAKIMDTRIFACARPPRMFPTSAMQKFTSFRVICPWFIRLAARMKSGTASRTNELRPLNIFMKTVRLGTNGSVAIPASEMMPMTKAIGTPRKMSSTKNPTISAGVMTRPPSRRGCECRR